MAIDPKKYGKFREEVDDLVETVPGIKDGQTDEIIENHIDEFLNEYEDLLNGERPPRLYVLGDAGAGKSSLINALANKDVAEVGDTEPTTEEPEVFDISFEEQYSDWEVVDSRGLFESKSPDGGLPEDTIKFMKENIEEYHPDVLLHIMESTQVRSGKHNFDVISELEDDLENVPPILTVLNKVDTYKSRGGDWPPEDNPEWSEKITDNLDFLSEIMSDVVLKEDLSPKPLDNDAPVKGYQFDSKNHIGVIPVYLQEEPYWNIDTLSLMIGDYLPDDSRLQFFQAQQRASIMRKIAQNMTKSASKSAAAIGATPTSYADVIPLTALQYVLIALIGGLSCREMEKKTVVEFLGSMGVVTGSAIALRKLARGLVQFVPGGGQVVSAAVAGSGTYAMGKSAEKYFFDGLVSEPDNFMDQGEELFNEPENDPNHLDTSE